MSSTVHEHRSAPSHGGDEGSHAAEANLAIAGMDCASCVAHVTRAAMQQGGAEACDVNLARGRAVVKFDPTHTTPRRIADSITTSGYPAAIETGETPDASSEQRRLHHQAEHAESWLRRAIVAIALWLPVEVAHWI